MATHYTCDRCGGPTRQPTRGIAVTFTSDAWLEPDGEYGCKEIVFGASVAGPHDECEGDAPDLCAYCRVWILREAATAIERQIENPRPVNGRGLPEVA